MAVITRTLDNKNWTTINIKWKKTFVTARGHAESDFLFGKVVNSMNGSHVCVTMTGRRTEYQTAYVWVDNYKLLRLYKLRRWTHTSYLRREVFMSYNNHISVNSQRNNMKRVKLRRLLMLKTKLLWVILILYS